MPPLSPWLERWWSQRRTPQLQFGSGRTAVRLPAEREAQFVLISGPARCGKTRRVVANLGHWSGSAVVIDREGETARATARERRGLGGQVAYLEASEDGQWPRIDGAGLLERPTTLYLLVRRTTPQLGGVLLDLVRALWDRMELGETTPRVPVAVFLDGVLDPVEVPLIELAREVRAVRGGGLLLLAYIPTLDRVEQRFGGDGLLELLNLAQTRVVFVERHLLDGVMGAWLRGLPLTVEMRRQIEDAALTQHGRMLVVPTRGRPLLTEIPRPGRDDARKGRR